MKAFFHEIPTGDLGAVVTRLDSSPELANAIAKAPPKKDDGQSALQVAIKSSNFAVAQVLLDRGADVNYIDRSASNRWNVPVVHDAIRAATFSTRFGRDRGLPGEPPNIEVMSTLERFEEALGVLRRMIALGADLNTSDSFGNPALARAVLDARQVIDEPARAGLAEDLTRIFDTLLDAGADPTHIDPLTDETLLESFRDEPVGRFLRR